MPTYTIQGKRYTTKEPLSQDQLKKLVSQVTQQSVNATPTDENSETDFFDKVKSSAVEILPDLGGLSGAAGGAALGAQLGSIVPGAGTIAGGVIGGAIGAFTGAGAGESVKKLIDEYGDTGLSLETLERIASDFGTSFSNKEARDQAVKDAIDTAGVAAKEGLLDITGAKALDVLGDTAKFVGSKVLPKAPPIKDMQASQELQLELTKRGSTLRGTQASPDDAVVEGIESAAEGGIGTGPIFREIAEAQQAYMDEQIEALIKSQSRLTTEQTGELMHNLINNTRIASGELYGKLFDAMESAGKGVKVNIMAIRNNASRGRYENMEGLTAQAREIAERGGEIPFLASHIQSAYKDILKLTPNMSFTTGFKKLKMLKQRLTALRGDPTTKSNPAVAELAGIVKQFENTLIEQANKSGPELAKSYQKLMSEYEHSQKVLFSDTMAEALGRDPELVARTLLSEGRTTPVKEIKKLVAEAKKLRKSGDLKGTVSDPLNGLRRSFLERGLAGEGGDGIAQMRGLESKLADPEFRRTFEALFDKGTVSTIDKLIKQAQILSRGPGGELALSIRSRQASAAETVIRPDRTIAQRMTAVLVAKLPNLMAEYVSDKKSIDRLLNLTKVVVRAQEGKKPIPAAAVRGILTMLGGSAVEVEGQRQQAEIEALRQQYGVQ